MASESIRRVVLLGMMGAGKSSVGEALARRLDWAHLDLDQEIERRQGRRIAELFRTGGEAGFRALEVAITEEIADRHRVVVSPGGGWVVNPGLVERLASGSLYVWLQITPEEAARRVGARRGDRPLLDAPDPLVTLRRLLAEREPHYRRADVAIPVAGRDTESISGEIERLVRLRLDGD